MIYTKFCEFRKDAEYFNKYEAEIVECDECDGEGDWTCECCGTVIECDECGGTGEIVINKVDSAKSDYFRKAVSDIKKLCLWSDLDFLNEIGQFIKSEGRP